MALPLSVVQELGREAYGLFIKYRAELEPRLPAGLGDGLKVDLDEFDGIRAEASSAVGTMKSATRKQNEVLEEANALLRAARGAISTSGTTKSEQGAFGIATKLVAAKVNSVVAALDSFAKGAAELPDVARRASLLSTDIAALKALREELVAVDQKQEAARSARKEPTRVRVERQRRIEVAIRAIQNAGQLHFVRQPAVAALFQALSRSKKR